jgi:hypothetical protein
LAVRRRPEAVGKIHLLGVRCERRGRVFAVGQQDLHALFGLLQFDLPLARQLYAALKFVERLFQRQIAAFQTGNNLLQFAQRSFKLAGASFFFGIVNVTLIFRPDMVTDSGLANNAQCAQERRDGGILARLDAATGVAAVLFHYKP